MKKIFFVLAAAAAFVACNNSAKEKETTDTSTTSQTTKMDNGPVSETTRNFFTTVANSGMAEVEIANYAKDNAQNSAVKDFASMLHHDHEAVNDRLKSLASSKNVTLPDSMSSDKRKMIDDLKAKKGKAFDEEFVNTMIKAHETSISLFESTASGDPDSDVRNFAGEILPKLRAHRDSAVAIQKKYFQ